MIALYDLNVCPTSYDFLVFLVTAATRADRLGEDLKIGFVAAPTEDGFRAGKMPLEWKQGRMENLLIPSISFVGASWGSFKNIEDAQKYLENGESFFPDSFPETNAWSTYMLPALYKEIEASGGRMRTLDVPELDCMKEHPRPYITITLRTSRNAHRNSNMKAWTEFIEERVAAGANVVVIPDAENLCGEWHDAALDIRYRMALYADAEMNLMVSNGPGSLCLFSDAPLLMFNMLCPTRGGKGSASEEHLRKIGIPPGSQFSFTNPNQRITWSGDSIEEIRHHYEQSRV